MMSNPFARPLILSLGGVALCALAAPALAQDASAPAQTAQSSDNGGVADIIVTARRRNESIQTTPVAVTAIAPAQLEASAAAKISDLQGLAPNVLITTQSTGAATANISIRGIAFADVDKSFDPAVGVNIDGVYIGTSTGQMLDFFDIGSIEILRGPQGTLFGRNTIAGVINVRRTRPTGQWGGKFEASFGSYGQIGLRGVLNVPVVPGVLAAKFFEFHQQDDGFYHAYGTGKHLGGSNQENFGAAFLFTPASNFDALLTLEKQQQHFGSYNGFIGETGDVFCGALPAVQCNRNNTTDIYTVFPGSAKLFGTYSAPAATLEMNWDTGPVKFTSVTSYRKSREHQLEDFGSSNLYLADRFQHYHQFSQELRASGKIFHGLDYVAGLYYFDSRYELVQNTQVFFAPAGTQDTIGKSRSEAAFVDFNWQILPRVRLSGGGRFTHDHKELDNPLILNDDGVSAVGRKGWSRFTPKVSLDYRPTNDLMAYASWSRGYRSGGFSGRGLSYYSATTPYNPETVDSYEIGLKSEFLDRKVALNLAAFYTDYRNIQQNSTVTLPPPGVGNETIVVNAAGAHIKGIEADLTARPVENLTIRGSFGYTHARFHGFLVNQPVTLADGSSVIRTFDFSKVNLIYAPKVTAAINAEYSIPMGRKELRLNAGYRFLSRYDQQIAADPAIYPALLADPTSTATVIVPRNDPRLRSDRQNLVDASISMLWDMNDSGAKARVTLFARNLLDDRGTATAFTVAAFPTLWAFTAAREPRVFGAQFGFDF